MTRGIGAVSLGNLERPLRNSPRSRSAVGANFELEQLRTVCGEFEGLLLAQILQEMSKTMLKSEFLNGGVVEEIFVEHFYAAVGREAGKRGCLGIGQLLYEQLARVLGQSDVIGQTAGGSVDQTV